MATKKAAAKANGNPPAVTDVTKPRTKTQVMGTIADRTGLSRKQVAAVFEEIGGLIRRDLGKKGPGIFTVPGLMKIKRLHKPKRPSYVGVNPFTKQEQTFKARPARNVVKVTALKGLKDMV